MLLDQIKLFLQDGWRMGKREWLYAPEAKIYLKMIYKVIEQEPVYIFALAAIEVKELYQRQGYASKLIQEMHQLNPFPYSFIECVHNEFLAAHLEKTGWTKLEENYYKKTST